ncbi:MAG: class II fructose-bisphosphate aldolase [Spirochaetaceae bacterium]|nr:MAG: class II fructose-bisphosphate aldolase [Spirochaetaceae bacterium]
MRNDEILKNAWRAALPVPAFNVPYLPMMEPLIEAARAEDAFCFVAVARIEWTKFQSKSMEAIASEFFRLPTDKRVRLHLDHIPVIDEDNLEVPYMDLIMKAIDLGFQSVMIDGSRLPLEENIAATRAVVEYAHERSIPVEAELGAVMGHESQPSMTYEEILRTKTGFTSPAEARRFVEESRCDWLSVAFGNIHGAVSDALRHQKKVAARLDIAHLEELQQAAAIPLVLHGGSGIPREGILQAVERGVAKINIGTEVRQVYEQALSAGSTVQKAQYAVMERTRSIFRDFLEISGTADRTVGE